MRRRVRLRHKKGGPEGPPSREERLRRKPYRTAHRQGVMVITENARAERIPHRYVTSITSREPRTQ
jgi:hypothetical protein